MKTAAEISKYTPAYEPVSVREPTESEKRLNRSLELYMEKHIALESDEEMSRRDTVLAEVRNIFVKFVRFVAVKVMHMPEDEAEDAGGELFISGSHRLGVRDVGADIDTVCVAPNFCTREHFFTYLKEDLMKRSEVAELNAVEGAFVPLISFDFRGVSIDLLFARLAENVVHRDIDILDDNILVGLDEPTEKSLNGPRVTNMIFKLVGPKTFPNFLVVLRCIRKWAKKRGIYGNKLGYLGGVNCNILVAFICQLFPNSCPSSLLFRFFKHYKDWKWPEPIMLNNVQQSLPGQPVTEERKVWNPKVNAKDLMPIITPAFPAMNSAYNVSYHTLMIMQQEINYGYEVMEGILKSKNWSEEQWDALFEPSDFFLRYPHYLACHIVANDSIDAEQARSWIAYVESRIRRLTQYPYLENLPLLPPIHLHPVVHKIRKSNPERKDNSETTDQPEADGSLNNCYFIGFRLDLDSIKRSGDKNIHIDEIVSLFYENLCENYPGEKGEGLDFFVEHLAWNKLPKEVFDCYGGLEKAKQLRTTMGFASIKSSTGDANKNASNPVNKETNQTTTNKALEAAREDVNMNNMLLMQSEATQTLRRTTNSSMLSIDDMQNRIVGFVNKKAQINKNNGSVVARRFSNEDGVGILIADSLLGDQQKNLLKNKRKQELDMIENSKALKIVHHDESSSRVIPNLTWSLLDQKL